MLDIIAPISDPAVPNRVIVSMPGPLEILYNNCACVIVKTIVTKNNNSNPQNSNDIKFILCICFSSFIPFLAETNALTLRYVITAIEINKEQTIV